MLRAVGELNIQGEKVRHTQKKKNQNWLFKKITPVIKRQNFFSVGITQDARKKAFIGLNYRHFATQRRETLYRRGFFWQLTPKGQKYGGLQKFRYKQSRKILGQVPVKIVKRLTFPRGVQKNVFPGGGFQKNSASSQAVNVFVKKKERKHEYGWKRKIYRRKPRFYRDTSISGVVGAHENSFNSAGANRSHNRRWQDPGRNYKKNFRAEYRANNWKNNEKTSGRNSQNVLSQNISGGEQKSFDRSVFRAKKKQNLLSDIVKIFEMPGLRRKFSTFSKVTKSTMPKLSVKLKYFRKKRNHGVTVKINKKKSSLKQPTLKMTGGLSGVITRMLHKAWSLKTRYVKKQLRQKSFVKNLVCCRYFRGNFAKRRGLKLKISRQSRLGVLLPIVSQKKKKSVGTFKEKKNFLQTLFKSKKGFVYDTSSVLVSQCLGQCCIRTLKTGL